MKTVKLLLNIGKPDARRLGLDKTLDGETVSVKDEVADEMIHKGWATDKLDAPKAEAPVLDPSAKPVQSADLHPAGGALPPTAVPDFTAPPKAADDKDRPKADKPK